MDYSKIHYPSLNDVPVSPYEMPNPAMKHELIKNEHAGPVEKRKSTNIEFLWLFGITVFTWLLLCFYCIQNGDLSRLDVELSSNATTLLKEFAYNVKLSSGEIYLSCTAAVALSALLIVLFRRFAGTIVWFVVGLVLMVLALGTAAAWYSYSQAAVPGSTEPKSTYSYEPTSKYTYNGGSSKSDEDLGVAGPIIVTIVFLVVALLLYAIRKHIRMVIRLFKEGGKVAQSMPFILAQPFVTFVTLAITLSLAVYFALWIETAGVLVKNEMGDEELQKTGLMQFAVVYNVLVVIWIVQFLIGCQHMVIAGATATWYFTRDKTRVNNAIMTSYKYLFKYHLGSVALGSLIITAIQIIRAMFKATMRKNRNIIGCIVGYLLTYFERFIIFLTKNAYIEIAIYGDGLCVSGKRAFRVLTENAIKVATINSVGDFVMLLGRCLITGLSVLMGYLLLQGKSSITQIAYPLIIIGIVSFAIVHAFMLAFEMIVDSVFICFCEDCDINDGIQRPYYMNKEMMVFMNEERPKTLKVGDEAPE